MTSAPFGRGELTVRWLTHIVVRIVRFLIFNLYCLLLILAIIDQPDRGEALDGAVGGVGLSVIAALPRGAVRHCVLNLMLSPRGGHGPSNGPCLHP